MHSDLVTIMKSHSQSETDGNFKDIFWQQPASLKGARSMQWHPAIIAEAARRKQRESHSFPIH